MQENTAVSNTGVAFRRSSLKKHKRNVAGEDDESQTAVPRKEYIGEAEDLELLHAPIAKYKKGVRRVVLICCWAIATYFLTAIGSDSEAPILATVPSNESVYYRIVAEMPSQLVSLTVVGPFLTDHIGIHSHYTHASLASDNNKDFTGEDDDENAAIYLTAQIVYSSKLKGQTKRMRTKRSAPTQQTQSLMKSAPPADPKNLSTSWKVGINDPGDFGNADMVRRDRTFELSSPPDSSNMYFIQFATVGLQKALPMEFLFDKEKTKEPLAAFFTVLVLIAYFGVVAYKLLHPALAMIFACTVEVALLTAMTHRPTLHTVMIWIECDRLMSVTGYMIILKVVLDTGFYDFFAVKLYKVCNGHVWPPINVLCVAVFFLSWLFDRVTAMLFVAPMGIRLAEVMNIHPQPVLISLMTFCSLSVISIPFGYDPRLLVMTEPAVMALHMTATGVFKHMLPITLVLVIHSYIHLRLSFLNIRKLVFGETADVMRMRRLVATWGRVAQNVPNYSKDQKGVQELVRAKMQTLQQKLERTVKIDKPTQDFQTKFKELEERYPMRNQWLLIRVGIVLVFIFFCQVLHAFHICPAVQPYWIAWIAALLLLVLIDSLNIDSLIEHLDWNTVLFLGCFAVFAQCQRQLGTFKYLGRLTSAIIGSFNPPQRFTYGLVFMCSMSAMASIFLSEYSVADAMIRTALDMSSKDSTMQNGLYPLVWAIIVGDILGSMTTLVSSSTNIICFGTAEQHSYKIFFGEYVKVALPIMLGNLLVANIYLLIVHRVIKWNDF